MLGGKFILRSTSDRKIDLSINQQRGVSFWRVTLRLINENKKIPMARCQRDFQELITLQINLQFNPVILYQAFKID